MVTNTDHINIRIEKSIAEALNSLNGIQTATAGSFFYAKVEMRLAAKKVDIYERICNLLSKPGVGIVGLCIVFVIDVCSIFYLRDQPATDLSNNTDELYWEEYYMTMNSVNYQEKQIP